MYFGSSVPVGVAVPLFAPATKLMSFKTISFALRIYKVALLVMAYPPSVVLFIMMSGILSLLGLS